MQILLEKNVSASSLCDIITVYPQILVNTKISNEKKSELDSNLEISKAIKQVEDELNGNGRVLVRPSGTEPLVRVMIEGENAEYIEKKANEIARVIEEELR